MKRQLIAFMAAAMLFFVFGELYDALKRSIIAPEFSAFAVVLSGKEGEKVTVQYTRIFNENLSGQWVAKVLDLSTGDVAIGKDGKECRNKGQGDYRVELNQTITRSLSWYLGMQCTLKPGTYVLLTTWDLKNQRGYRVVSTDTSPSFRILP